MKRFIAVMVITLLAVAGSVKAQESSTETNTPPRRRPALTDEQKSELSERANEMWNKLQPDAKIRLMRLHQALVEMPPEERKLIHQYVERFLSMSPAEREQQKKNLAKWNAMTPEQRARARELYQQQRRNLEQNNSATNTPGSAAESPTLP